MYFILFFRYNPQPLIYPRLHRGISRLLYEPELLYVPDLLQKFNFFFSIYPRVITKKEGTVKLHYQMHTIKKSYISRSSYTVMTFSNYFTYTLLK